MSNLFCKDKDNGGNEAEWRKMWDEVEAAQQYDALPSAVYEAEPTKKEMIASKRGTPGLKLTWRIAAGEFQGRRVWQDVWLSPAALPMAKRVLTELGMSSPDAPLPDGIVCAVQVVRQVNDNGTAYNEVRKVKHLRTEENPASPATAAAVVADSQQPPLHPEAGSPAAAPPASVKVDSQQPAPSVVVELDSPAAAPPASVKVDSQQPAPSVVVELDSSVASTITADVVRQVADAVPVDEPTDLDELCRLLPQRTSNSVMLALGVLVKHGLRQKQHRATWMYWWAGDRPALDVRSPVKAEKVLAKDEQFFADMRAARAAKQEGGQNARA